MMKLLIVTISLSFTLCLYAKDNCASYFVSTQCIKEACRDNLADCSNRIAVISSKITPSDCSPGSLPSSNEQKAVVQMIQQTLSSEWSGIQPLECNQIEKSCSLRSRYVQIGTSSRAILGYELSNANKCVKNMDPAQSSPSQISEPSEEYFPSPQGVNSNSSSNNSVK